MNGQSTPELRLVEDHDGTWAVVSAPKTNFKTKDEAEAHLHKIEKAVKQYEYREKFQKDQVMTPLSSLLESERDKKLLRILYDWFGGFMPTPDQLYSSFVSYAQDERVAERLRDKIKKNTAEMERLASDIRKHKAELDVQKANSSLRYALQQIVSNIEIIYRNYQAENMALEGILVEKK